MGVRSTPALSSEPPPKRKELAEPTSTAGQPKRAVSDLYSAVFADVATAKPGATTAWEESFAFYPGKQDDTYTEGDCVMAPQPRCARSVDGWRLE